jgi:outer membrane protein TolC
VRVGTAAPQLGLQAEIAVARAERELAGAEVQRSSAEMAFANLTGLPADAELLQPTSRELPYASVDDALARATDQRGDIVAAGYQSRAAHAQATGTTLSWLPQVDGRFTEAYTGNSGFSGEPYTWQLVIAGKWTLWDGGARVAEQAKAASMVRMAETAEEKTLVDAKTEVTTLWEQHERAGRAVNAVERELALATENARLAEAAFDAGTLSFLDLEDAQLGLDAARLTRLSEQMNLDVSAIQLLAATGDLH